MKGNCENCKHMSECKKEIGFLFGFCNTDFEPITNQYNVIKQYGNGTTTRIEYDIERAANIYNSFVMEALQDAKPGTFVSLTLDGTIIAKFEYTGGAY